MKTIAAPLQALLDSRAFKMADLFVVETVGGLILRHTSFDVDLIWDGNTYSHTGLFIRRSKAAWKNDLSVDSMSIEVSPDATGGLVSGVPFLQALRAGVFDAAAFTCNRAFMPVDSSTVTGVVNIFSGRFGDIDDTGTTRASINVNSHLELLNVDMPRNVYEVSCILNLYDAICGVNKATHTVTGYINNTATRNSLPVSTNAANGYYAGGVITFTSGANAGVVTTVQDYQGRVITLSTPLPSMPIVGDAYSLIPGCDKTQATCTTKFSNLLKFRGFPYIPVVETAY